MGTNIDRAADRRKWLILTVVVIKVMMDGLDGSMLNIALPSISRSIGVTSGAVIWIVSAYSITTATTVLFFGRLGDIIGKTKFYIIGIAIYIISTVFS
jgi:MFS family permease